MDLQGLRRWTTTIYTTPGKFKPAKVPNTPEQRKKELEKYWVKTPDMMEEEAEFVDNIFGEELDGIQKAIPVTVKYIRQLDGEEKTKHGSTPS